MIGQPRLGMQVGLERHRLLGRSVEAALLGRIIGIVKRPFMGYRPGQVFVKKANGDIVAVHKGWLYEVEQ